MVLVAPRGDGVLTSLIHTSYSTAAGTAYVTFENVFVPADFVITEKDGLRIILSNFNRERCAFCRTSHFCQLTCLIDLGGSLQCHLFLGNGQS